MNLTFLFLFVSDAVEASIVQDISLYSYSSIAVLTFLSCFGNSDNVCDIRGEFSKEWNFGCSSHPAANVTHQFSVLRKKYVSNFLQLRL